MKKIFTGMDRKASETDFAESNKLCHIGKIKAIASTYSNTLLYAEIICAKSYFHVALTQQCT